MNNNKKKICTQGVQPPPRPLHYWRHHRPASPAAAKTFGAVRYGTLPCFVMPAPHTTVAPKHAYVPMNAVVGVYCGQYAPTPACGKSPIPQL